MLGDWENPEATESSIREDLWLHTGDLGALDEQGRLRLSSRPSDLILRGGENVYLVQVEHALAAHPDVVDRLVSGVAAADLGPAVRAVGVQGAPPPPTG